MSLPMREKRNWNPKELKYARMKTIALRRFLRIRHPQIVNRFPAPSARVRPPPVAAPAGPVVGAAPLMPEFALPKPPESFSFVLPDDAAFLLQSAVLCSGSSVVSVAPQ